MKIKFIKDHNKYKAGDIVEVPDARGKYWVMVKAAVNTDEVPAKKAPAKKATAKPKATKADKPASKRITKELKTKVKNK